MTVPVRIGTRGSALAMAQAELVRVALVAAGHATTMIVIETQGDRRPPDTAWGEGAFVAAIERALLEDRVDVAVHSAKDVPTEEDARLRIAAYLPRADARDALVVSAGSPTRLDELPAGSRLGTDSPRRTGFVLARRPDLVVHALHGNVDTRLRRLDAGETDALILACAGLDRLGLADRIAERLDPELVPPAPGQGAIAVQVRADDERRLAACSAVDHAPTRFAVEAERAFLRASGGGCRAPIGAHATVEGDAIRLLGGVVRVDGSEVRFGRRSTTDAATIGRALAAELGFGRDGAPRRDDEPPQAPRILVTRPSHQAGPILRAMRGVGLDPVLVPAIEIEPGNAAGLAAALGRLETYAWVVVTSVNGARAIEAAEPIRSRTATPRWAAVGAASRSALERLGVRPVFEPTRRSAGALADELPVGPGDRVLLVRGDLADGDMPEVLRARGVEVDDVTAYRTREAPEGSGPLLRAAVEAGPIAAIAFTSGSTVRGLHVLADAAAIDIVRIPAVCLGPETAAAARAVGHLVLAVPVHPDATAFARATADALDARTQEIR